MNYYIFRIKKGFKNIINDIILTAILEKEHDKYYFTQLDYILDEISWDKVVQQARQYFTNRKDVNINDFSISYKRINEENSDELIMTSKALRLHLEHENSPLLTFLEEFNEYFVFIKKNMMDRVGC